MQILDDAARRAIAYLNSLQHRPVSPRADSINRLNTLDTPMPQRSTPANDVLSRLDEFVSPATMAMAGPRFFGFVVGGSLPVTLAANWLAAAWDQNASHDASTPGVARVEEIAQRWLLEMLNLPEQCAVGFVTGATVANFTALAAARNAVLKQCGWSVEADGLFGAPPIQIVVRRYRVSSNIAEVARDARSRPVATDSCADRLPGAHSRRQITASCLTLDHLPASWQCKQRRLRFI